MATAMAKTVKCPTFDGKQEKFLDWYWMFEAFADMHGFEKAVTPTADARMPARHDSPPDGDAAVAALEVAVNGVDS
jgi:hypothetical protein